MSIEISPVASVNAAALALEVAAVSGRGGGRIVLPRGIIPITTLILPKNVTLEGYTTGASA